MLAGKFGLSLFSLSGGTPESFATLDTNWQAYEETCHRYGHTPRREKWRMMGPLFLGETHQEVDRAISRRLPPNVEYIADVVKLFFPDNIDWMESAQKTIDRWRSDAGIPIYGKGVFGPPDEAIREIERLWDKSGGFGGFVILVHDLADYEATRRSFELFAEEVIPHFRAYRNRARAQSLHYVNTNIEKLYTPVAADGAAAREDYARSKAGPDPQASAGQQVQREPAE
jgi:limonene 1,2-monooxygenase